LDGLKLVCLKKKAAATQQLLSLRDTVPYIGIGPMRRVLQMLLVQEDSCCSSKQLLIDAAGSGRQQLLIDAAGSGRQQLLFQAAANRCCWFRITAVALPSSCL
jgi:hypothetical protein